MGIPFLRVTTCVPHPIVDRNRCRSKSWSARARCIADVLEKPMEVNRCSGEHHKSDVASAVQYCSLLKNPRERLFSVVCMHSWVETANRRLFLQCVRNSKEVELMRVPPKN